MVYAKKPFAGPQQVLDYVGRYTHRVAISNNRILNIENCQVTFRYKDYRNGSQQKTMPLSADEFIRRFLIQVLPNGFQRIRRQADGGRRPVGLADHVHDAPHALCDPAEAATSGRVKGIEPSRSSARVRPAAEIAQSYALRRALMKSSCQYPHLARGQRRPPPTTSGFRASR